MALTGRRVVACTIVAHNYLPFARMVARSFLDQHPDGRFVVVLIDRAAEADALEGECFEIVQLDDIDFGPQGWVDMAAEYTVTEFATAVKPFALKHLVPAADCVLYLDPDIYVFSSLDPLIEATIEAGWSLTPHAVAPMPRTGAGPTEEDIKGAGVYNLGYIGVTAKSVDLLDWWAERLRHDAIVDPANQLFTDQRWIDLAVPIFSPYIERSTAYNVAYWNLDQRRFWFDGDVPMVDDEPLRFFHFSGFVPDQLHWLTKYHLRPRVLLSQHPDVGRLCEVYAAEMYRFSAGTGPIAPYGWGEVCAGLPFTLELRRIFRDELIESERDGSDLSRPPNPFVPGQLGAFLDWLVATPPTSKRRVPRYLEAVWASRSDLHSHFPEVESGRTSQFVDWCRRSGRHENELINFLGPPPPSSLSGHVTDVAREPGGVDVVGYFRADLGVGEAGRLARRALSAAGVPTETIACHAALSRQGTDFDVTGVGRHLVSLVAVNADMLPAVRDEIGPEYFAGRHVIGQWFWELETFPNAFRRSFDLVDELWVATRFVRDALVEAGAPVPVQHMPLPLVAPTPEPGLTKASFGLDDRFVFLFVFDMLSVLRRKNPLGLIEAFCAAFTPGEGPVLVLKTMNGSKRVNDMERLRHAARHRPDVVIMDEHLDAATTAALTNACDCYVSLHRSEGLGLTMSEAMALGKPVIATGYSGNVDFMTPRTAYLVPWERSVIGKGAEPYPADAVWAEPDLEAAARLMREVHGDPEAAAAVGRAAAADLAVRFSAEAVGAAMKQRLEQIWEERRV